jgi:hypothetical protein
MSVQPYSRPIRQLFHQGDPDLIQDWSSYLKLGLTVNHLDELAQMAIDRKLFEAEETGWAPIHAWRTLAMLQDDAAIDPLIQVLRTLSDTDLTDEDEEFDWVSEELPLVFGQVGPMALAALRACLTDTHLSNRVRENAVVSIAEIANEDEETRSDCLAMLTQQLEKFADQDSEFNGFLVTVLVGSLRAVESADVIERAFLADRVTVEVIQNWDEAQVFLGLKEPPDLSQLLSSELLPEQMSSSATLFKAKSKAKSSSAIGSPSSYSPFYSGVPKSKTQAKRKAQKQSRKKNRKK